MATIVRARRTAIRTSAAAWLPLALLPVVVVLMTATQPPWVQMWALAIAIYASFKWLTFASSPAAHRASLKQATGYLFLWTGMDAESFFRTHEQPATPRWSEWIWAIAQTAVGCGLLLGLAPRFLESHPLVAGWMTMTGVVSILHFGSLHLLSLVWRSAGINAQHIMHKPVCAASLTDFWSRRWNLPFRDLMHRFVFQPLVPSIGVAWTTLAVFLVSGLLHDAVISLPAHGGWGLPTLYFVIQGLAVLLQRCRLGKRLGVGRGFRGWLFAVLVIAAPAGLLFHPPFLRHVVVPMLPAIQAARP